VAHGGKHGALQRPRQGGPAPPAARHAAGLISGFFFLFCSAVY
jgi:hypothetical protein